MPSTVSAIADSDDDRLAGRKVRAVGEVRRAREAAQDCLLLLNRYAILCACTGARLKVIHSFKVCLGASYRVVEILLRSEHLVVIEIAPVEQIKGDAFEAAIPSFRRSVRPSVRVVGQKSVPQRVAMVVESDYAVGHEDMVPGEAFTGDDALGIKSGKGCLPQKHSGENGTRAISEEDAVRQSPASNGVFLYAGLQHVHGRRTSKRIAESMTTSLVDDPCLVNQMPSILKLCSRSKDLGEAKTTSLMRSISPKGLRSLYRELWRCRARSGPAVSTERRG